MWLGITLLFIKMFKVCLPLAPVHLSGSRKEEIRSSLGVGGACASGQVPVEPEHRVWGTGGPDEEEADEEGQGLRNEAARKPETAFRNTGRGGY